MTHIRHLLFLSWSVLVPLLTLTLMAFFYSSISHEHIEILTVNGELLFFRQREGPFYPTLRLLHKCESLLVYGLLYISLLLIF